MNNNEYFEKAFIRKSYMKYILPSICSLIFGQVAPLVDALCISGKLGEEALSAMSIVLPLYYFFSIIAVLGGVGGGVGISKSSGAGDKEKAARIFTKSILWLIAATIILSSICLFFIESLLSFLQATPENFIYAKDYLTVVLIGMVFYVLNLAGVYIVTNDNNPNLAMTAGIVSGTVNMIIDYVGMYILNFGIWVAAFGTVFGAFCGCVVFMFHGLKKDRLCNFEFAKNPGMNIRMFEILSPGTPEAMQYFIISLQIFVANYVLSTNAGTSGLGNAAVIDNLKLVISILVAAFSEATIPLAASYFGEQNEIGIRFVKKTALCFGFIAVLPLSLSLIIYPQWFMYVFSIKDNVMSLTLPTAIRITAISQIFVIINAILLSFLASVDEEKKANISHILLGVIQIIFTLILSKFEPMDAPWYANLIGYICVFIYFVTYCKLFSDIMKTNNNDYIITGGLAEKSEVMKWYEQAKNILNEKQLAILWEKMLNPFINSLAGKKKTKCSFLVFKKANGEKTAILRYDSPKDFLGTDEDNSENQEFLSSGTCIRSEFNFLRRMMINFEGAIQHE